MITMRDILELLLVVLKDSPDNAPLTKRRLAEALAKLPAPAEPEKPAA